jgi:hypothetical protein
MPRSKGQDGRVVSLTRSLENATAALVHCEYIERITRLRVEQARHRSGLHDLLNPALQELDEMTRSVQVAKQEVAQALAQLIGD